MSSFPAKLQAASTADSWHLALDKFPFHPASTDAPTLAPQADHRGPTRNKELANSNQLAHTS